MSNEWIKVCAVADIPEEGTLQVAYQGQPVCIYRLEDGIYATHDTCTHGRASLADGFIDGDCIECPLHQGLFDIRSGKAVSAPCTVDLKTFAVRVEGEQVFVADAPNA